MLKMLIIKIILVTYNTFVFLLEYKQYPCDSSPCKNGEPAWMKGIHFHAYVPKTSKE